jgi:hypothetical protein
MIYAFVGLIPSKYPNHHHSCIHHLKKTQAKPKMKNALKCLRKNALKNELKNKSVRRHERKLEISLSLDNDDFGIIE